MKQGSPALRLVLTSCAGKITRHDVQEAALRVGALLEAAREDVTYYFARTNLRIKPGSSVAHRIFYDTLYHPRVALAFQEHQEWHVPVNNLLELGMVLYV